jgi:hypothetical protein
MYIYACIKNILVTRYVEFSSCMLIKLGFWSVDITCNKCLPQQKGVDLALQMQLPCTAPSCGRHTDVVVFGKDLPLLECSQCKSAYFSTDHQYTGLYINLCSIVSRLIPKLYSLNLRWCQMHQLMLTHIYLIECKPASKVMQDSWFMEVC